MLHPIFLWAVTFALALTGLRRLGRIRLTFQLSSQAPDRELAIVIDRLRTLQEVLQSGLVPTTEDWEKLRDLPQPWGRLAGESLSVLRENGSAVVPTLVRIRGLAEEHRTLLASSRTAAAQALAQAMVCTALVPTFGISLSFLLPGLAEHATAWWSACGMALASSLFGARWLLRMAESARWAGLPPHQRAWILAVHCAGERFLAWTRGGATPDLAWNEACQALASESVELSQTWGTSLWAEPEATPHRSRVPARQSLAQAGSAIRRAVQLALMEGRPSAERVEAALASLRLELRGRIEREVQLLGTRALKPLFLCIAPALLGLLGWALFLSLGNEVQGELLAL